MKVLILGVDGYIGWSLALHLLKRGHEVAGVDNLIRRMRVQDLGSSSLTPIQSWNRRNAYALTKFGPQQWRSKYHIHLGHGPSDVIADVIADFSPDAIVHLAEQPSAAYSMRSAVDAKATQRDNVIGTLDLLWAMKEFAPRAHLIKLGTMGEYGTPSCDIPEGKIPERCLGGKWQDEDLKEHCPMSGLMFPRTAGSFYHISKVHDTHNIEFACRNWGLSSTDIMQGVVFGLNEYENLDEITRFDYDECFGTVLNRFCAQAIINHPLTVYGKGFQTRGYLPLKDSIQCLTIVLENPPGDGEYRTLNQFENIYSVWSLAGMVCLAANELGLYPVVENIPNPRKEMEEHYYNPAHQKLFDMGYKPTTDIKGEIKKLIEQILPYKDNVRRSVIVPKTTWV